MPQPGRTTSKTECCEIEKCAGVATAVAPSRPPSTRSTRAVHRSPVQRAALESWARRVVKLEASVRSQPFAPRWRRCLGRAGACSSRGRRRRLASSWSRALSPCTWPTPAARPSASRPSPLPRRRAGRRRPAHAAPQTPPSATPARARADAGASTAAAARRLISTSIRPTHGRGEAGAGTCLRVTSGVASAAFSTRSGRAAAAVAAAAAAAPAAAAAAGASSARGPAPERGRGRRRRQDRRQGRRRAPPPPSTAAAGGAGRCCSTRQGSRRRWRALRAREAAGG